MSHGIEQPIWLAGLGQPSWLPVKINPIPAEPRTGHYIKDMKKMQKKVKKYQCNIQYIW